MSTPRRQLSTLQRYTVLGLLSLTLGTIYALVLRHAHSTAASGGESSEISVAADSPASFNTVAPFTLTDSSGKPFTLAALLGKPWIVDFVFTRCTGPCPVVTSSMRKAQDLLAGDAVHLVTITVDPEYDTPEVLAEYAHGIGADLSRWTFLTGPPELLQDISRTSFMLPIVKEENLPVGQSIVHRTDLVVVDAHGVVRGYYDGESQTGVEKAVARARYLVHEPDTSKTDANQRDTTRPHTTRPDTTPPDTNEPDNTKPDAKKSDTTQSGASRPR